MLRHRLAVPLKDHSFVENRRPGRLYPPPVARWYSLSVALAEVRSLRLVVGRPALSCWLVSLGRQLARLCVRQASSAGHHRRCRLPRWLDWRLRPPALHGYCRLLFAAIHRQHRYCDWAGYPGFALEQNSAYPRRLKSMEYFEVRCASKY